MLNPDLVETQDRSDINFAWMCLGGTSLKFIIILLVLIVGVYFGADYLLSSHLKSTATTRPEDEKALVQNMAKFLEQSPDFQKKISESGQALAKQESTPNPSTPNEVELSGITRYFGNSATDQFFKKYFAQHLEQTNTRTELSDYIHSHPKESTESLENALQSIPREMTNERSAVVSAFIHSAIIFVEELGTDDQAKKIYLKRLIENTQDSEIKDALENHFPELLIPLIPPPKVR